MLRSGKCDTDNLIGDLDRIDFQADENPKNFGHNFILRVIDQLATDPQGNWFWQTHNEAADSSGKNRHEKLRKGRKSETGKMKKWKGEKAKTARSAKVKGEIREKAESERLESKVANPYESKDITIVGGRTPIRK